MDPALKSALGLTVWAEDPATSRWYCVKAKYLKGILVPTDLVEAVRQETYQYNIVRRISDPHEVWYIQTAASMGVIPMYQGIFNKANRKGELIKNFQEALGNKIFIAPWCEDFISELQECRWSESQANTIINQHAYHITDSAQYFVDAIPAPGQRAAAVPVHQYMYEQNEARKLGVETKKKQMENIRVQRRGRGKSW